VNLAYKILFIIYFTQNFQRKVLKTKLNLPHFALVIKVKLDSLLGVQVLRAQRNFQRKVLKIKLNPPHFALVIKAKLDFLLCAQFLRAQRNFQLF